MNPRYTEKVRIELDKLLASRFIHPVEIPEWLSPIVVVTKKMARFVYM